MALERLRKKIRPLLLPFSLLYGIGVSIRNVMFNLNILKSKEFDIPIISVGNISVGGTGKTPFVEYLLDLMLENYKIAALSRGYRRSTKGFVVADKKTKPNEIGDEAFQIHKKFKKAKVAVDADRVRGVGKLLNKYDNLNAIILDDAYQHRYIKPGVSIVLIDYNRPVFKDYLLPAGNLRERKHNLRRANIVIVTKVPEKIKPIQKRIWIKELKLYPYQFLYFTTICYESLKSVFNDIGAKKEMVDKKNSVLLITGIASTKTIFEKVSSDYGEVVHLSYPDHHDYDFKDIEKIEKKFDAIKNKNKFILTTEKDAVKLKHLKIEEKLKNKMFYLPMKIKFLDNKETEFNKKIISYVKDSKRIGRLHS